MDFEKTTLKNGLRIITVPDSKSQAITVLVVVGAGSKYENKQNNGISHFLEHMFFKGTKKRPNTLSIAETLDRVGGAYNAFTSKEFTGYYAKTAYKHFDLALDWVSDIFLNSKIEETEIQREKGVILEEVNMRQDMPMAYIGDLWEKLLYVNQPAGFLTIGEKENILSFERKHFSQYLKNHYSAANTIVCMAGRFSQAKAKQKVKQYFNSINEQKPQDKVKTLEKQTTPQTLLHFKKTDQTHLCLGARGYGLADSQKYAQEILAVILGGNMSSRMFIEVRERRGLAYYVSTSAQVYTDSGYLLTQAGVQHSKTKQTIEVILKEYSKIRDQAVSKQELQKAKDYLKGSMILGLESSDAQASFYAGQELLENKILTIKQKCAIIDKITAQEVQKIAQDLFKNKGLNLAIIGLHKQESTFNNILDL